MTFQVELWQVILLFIAVIGFIFTWIIRHETRITKVETICGATREALDEIKKDGKETLVLLRKHIEKEV